LVALLVIGAALFGISTRPVGYLAQVWPANALLLGLLVRHPGFARLSSWLSAVLAFIAADLLTGSSFDKALWLTAANVAGVFAGWLAFQRMPERVLNLTEPASCLYLLAGAVVASLAAGIVGMWVAEPLLQVPMLEGLVFWFATELVNYLVILPVMLSRDLAAAVGRARAGLFRIRRSDLMPVGTVLISMAIATLVGGPGAIAFPVPGILWCALRYGVTTAAVLTAVVCLWQMTAATSMLGLAATDAVFASISARLGIALFSLAPLTVASTNASRERLIAELRQSLSRDALTTTMARSAFLEQAQDLMRAGGRLALLVVDIDHFKTINDTHGHQAGDLVLRSFGECLMRQVRPGDLVGRLGGEEFGILLRDVDAAGAGRVAERMRKAVEELQVTAGDERIRITISVGLARFEDGYTLPTLLDHADQALYAAKRAGRDRVFSYRHSA
jgi:diguanylate cyclase (GGDEF)-like protein